MDTLFVFATNVSDLEGAANARHYHGALNTCYSTEPLRMKRCHDLKALNMLKAAFPDNPVFRGDHRLFWYDEHGNEVL